MKNSIVNKVIFEKTTFGIIKDNRWRLS